MMDKYSKAIEYLTQHPEQIIDAWRSPRTHDAGCLFDFVHLDACLSMMRFSPHAYTDSPWHTEIIADERIPSLAHEITVEDLPVFAEWQRKINEM